MSGIPTLSDGTLTLRAPTDDDVAALRELNLDPLVQEWTSVPPSYSLDDARTHVRHVVPAGWETDREWAFVVQAPHEGGPRVAATVALLNRGAGRAEVAYAALPWARGTGHVEAAVRLLLDWGFAERDLRTVLWLAKRGNWPSRRLAWRLGFTDEGGLRGWMEQRGDLHDAWVGTLRAGEETSPRTPWLDSVRIEGRSVVLRPLGVEDLPRVVETRGDAETKRWLQRVREEAPHTLESHATFLDDRLLDAAAGRAVHWAFADASSDLYLGQVALFGVQHRQQAELAYWTHPHARRRGWTTEACRLLVRHAFIPLEDGGLGLRRLVADSAAGNEASHRVLERSGFVRTGRERQSTPMADGTWEDTLRWDQLAEERDRTDW